MKHRTTTLLALASLTALIAAAYPAVHELRDRDDREEIINHIRSIFDAYIRQDEAAIRALHREDWVGFRSSSRQIIHGIEGYMAGVSLELFQMLDYEIEEIDVRVYGEAAVVYYVAHWTTRLVATGQDVTFHARSVDVYTKDDRGWNQAGSNLNVLPKPGSFQNPVCGQCFDVGAAQ